MSAVLRRVRSALGAGLLAVMLTIAMPSAQAQQLFCGEHEIILKMLEQQFREKRTAFGVTADGRLLEVFAGPSGSWTILVTHPSGPTCLATSGGGWQEIDNREKEPFA